MENTWQELGRQLGQPGTADDMQEFQPVSINLPSAARNADFQLRFRSTGDPAFDDWFIDNVRLRVPELGLREAVSEKLRRPTTTSALLSAEYPLSELASITKLDPAADANSPINDLNGIKYLVNLRSLDLSGSSLTGSDLAAIRPRRLTPGAFAGEEFGLNELEHLTLSNIVTLSDINSLAGLSKLQTLRLDGTNLDPLSDSTLNVIKEMPDLTTLRLPTPCLASSEDNLIFNEGSPSILELADEIVGGNPSDCTGEWRLINPAGVEQHSGNTSSVVFTPADDGILIFERLMGAPEAWHPKFPIFVRDVPPTIHRDHQPIIASTLPDITRNEDAVNHNIHLAGVFHDNDPVDDAAMTYAVTENSNITLVTTSVAGDTLTLDFQDRQFGTALITVTAISGRNTISDTFIVTITDVNDPPLVTSALPDITRAEDAVNHNIHLAGVFHDYDPIDDATMTYVVTQNTNPFLVTTSVVGDTLTLDFQDHQFGTASISVTATSGGDTVNETFLVTITNVNDPPIVINPLRDITRTEDAANHNIDLAGVFHDNDPVDDTAMTYAVTANSNSTLVTTSINGETLTLDFPGSAIWPSRDFRHRDFRWGNRHRNVHRHDHQFQRSSFRDKYVTRHHT